MALLKLDSPAAKSLGIMLLLIALCGKLAFFQLRAGSKALSSTMLLEKVTEPVQFGQTLEKIDKAAHGDKLGATLAKLQRERAELDLKLEKVTAEQKHAQQLKMEKKQEQIEDAKVEKAIAAAHKKEVQTLESTLHMEIAKKQSLLKDVDGIRGVGTHTDEAMVALVMKEAREQKQEKELSVRLAEAKRAREAAAETRKAEAELHAQEDLVKKGLVKPVATHAQEKKVMATVKSQQKRLADAQWTEEQKQNQKLAVENSKLEHQIAVMKAKEEKRLAKEREEMRIMHGKSDTGVGKRLAKAGIVVDSWGPVTSTAGTKPDPRDTFAKMPKSMILPKVTPPKPVLKQLKTVGDLEQDLGFKSSILYSKNFDKTW